MANLAHTSKWKSVWRPDLPCTPAPCLHMQTFFESLKTRTTLQRISGSTRVTTVLPEAHARAWPVHHPLRPCAPSEPLRTAVRSVQVDMHSCALRVSLSAQLCRCCGTIRTAVQRGSSGLPDWARGVTRTAQLCSSCDTLRTAVRFE